MAIIVNGVNIPTNGEYLTVNDVAIDKVVANGVTVWEKITQLSIENSQIRNYVDIQSSGGETSVSSNCKWHQGCPSFKAIVWYCKDADEDNVIYTVTPKSPYTKIKASFHNAGGLTWDDDWTSCCINGHYIEENETYTIEAPSIEIHLIAGTCGGETHWQTEIQVCMYDVTLM